MGLMVLIEESLNRLASQNGHVEVVKVLLDRGADKEAKTQVAMTPSTHAGARANAYQGTARRAPDGAEAGGVTARRTHAAARLREAVHALHRGL